MKIVAKHDWSPSFLPLEGLENGYLRLHVQRHSFSYIILPIWGSCLKWEVLFRGIISNEIKTCIPWASEPCSGVELHLSDGVRRGRAMSGHFSVETMLGFSSLICFLDPMDSVFWFSIFVIFFFQYSLSFFQSTALWLCFHLFICYENSVWTFKPWM